MIDNAISWIFTQIQLKCKYCWLIKPLFKYIKHDYCSFKLYDNLNMPVDDAYPSYRLLNDTMISIPETDKSLGH